MGVTGSSRKIESGVVDAVGQLVVEDWGFNGWGLDAPYRQDDTVPVAPEARREILQPALHSGWGAPPLERVTDEGRIGAVRNGVRTLSTTTPETRIARE